VTQLTAQKILYIIEATVWLMAAFQRGQHSSSVFVMVIRNYCIPINVTTTTPRGWLATLLPQCLSGSAA